MSGMNIQDMWEKALSKTEIVRPRICGLKTFSETALPYIFLAESRINKGDTVVRKGEVVVEKPAIILPPDIPFFEGFEFDTEHHFNQDMLTNFLLVRGVRFPSFKYNNKTSSLDVHEGELGKAVKIYSNMLAKQENVETGLIMGPEDCWQFSVLLFICGQVARSASNDIKKFLEGFEKK